MAPGDVSDPIEAGGDEPPPRAPRRDRGVPLLMLAFSPLLLGMGGLLAWLCLTGALFWGFLVVALACLFLGLVALANGLRAWGVFLPSHVWGVRTFLSWWTWAARRKPGQSGEEAPTATQDEPGDEEPSAPAALARPGTVPPTEGRASP